MQVEKSKQKGLGLRIEIWYQILYDDLCDSLSKFYGFPL